VAMDKDKHRRVEKEMKELYPSHLHQRNESQNLVKVLVLAIDSRALNESTRLTS
jgi:hypothetical protein